MISDCRNSPVHHQDTNQEQNGNHEAPQTLYNLTRLMNFTAAFHAETGSSLWTNFIRALDSFRFRPFASDLSVITLLGYTRECVRRPATGNTLSPARAAPPVFSTDRRDKSCYSIVLPFLFVIPATSSGHSSFTKNLMNSVATTAERLSSFPRNEAPLNLIVK